LIAIALFKIDAVKLTALRS